MVKYVGKNLGKTKQKVSLLKDLSDPKRRMQYRALSRLIGNTKAFFHGSSNGLRNG